MTEEQRPPELLGGPWLLLTAHHQRAVLGERILELEVEAFRELVLTTELEETESPQAGAGHVAEAAAGHAAQAEVLRARARVLASLLDRT